MSTNLFVGINSDKELRLHKGPPIYNEVERENIMKGCKWATNVVSDTSYIPDTALLDELKCKYYAHGDDWIKSKDGTDILSIFDKLDRLKLYKRTPGVSTTNITRKLIDLLETEN